ncbi:MAG: serine/threonine protein kinase [Chloroflexota bacterium]|nr:serine/threonine protein kinase [Chloroflexota bacterium]
MTLLPGTTVGRYQILEPLGQGGMATVYKAFQPSLQREVALKVLRPGYAQDAEFRERFEREAIAIAKLRHPHIVQVFDFEVAPSGEYVLAMEFLEGGTLKDRLATLLAQGRWLEPTESVRIVGEVAEALSYAHEKGIVHRDVKPSNVMLTHKDWAVVTDFGIARILGATAHTQTGVGIGTPEYMAPEQGQGASVDRRADIYSLGAMAYELLIGRVPYSADTPLAVVVAHIKDPLPLPSKVNPTIGPGVERALLKALAKDREQRFVSASAFAETLAAGLASDSKGGTLPTVVVRGAASAAATSVGAAATRGSGAAAGAMAWRSRLSLPPVLSRHPVLTGTAAGLAVLVMVGGVLAGTALRIAPAAAPRPAATAALGVPSASAAPSASSGPSASAVATLRTGPLLWSAPLDATGSAFTSPDVGGDPAASKIVMSAGAIEIDALKIGGDRGLGTQRRVPPAFVGEIDLHVRPGSDMHFSWGFRNGPSPEVGGYALVLDTLASTLQVWHNVPASNSSTLLTAPVVVPGIASGRTVTLAVVADPPRYQVYADDRLVTAFTDHALDSVASALWVGGGDGSGGQVVVTGVRAYALPTGPSGAAPGTTEATAPAIDGRSIHRPLDRSRILRAG